MQHSWPTLHAAAAHHIEHESNKLTNRAAPTAASVSRVGGCAAAVAHDVQGGPIALHSGGNSVILPTCN